MSNKELLRPLSLSIGASLLPSFSLVSASTGDCHGKICHPIDEYCSAFAESCAPCTAICDTKSHNYQASTCAKECAGEWEVERGITAGNYIQVLMVYILYIECWSCLNRRLAHCLLTFQVRNVARVDDKKLFYRVTPPIDTRIIHKSTSYSVPGVSVRCWNLYSGISNIINTMSQSAISAWLFTLDSSAYRAHFPSINV